jgi:hypothetical protein
MPAVCVRRSRIVMGRLAATIETPESPESATVV